jgi:hypothetical protein
MDPLRYLCAHYGFFTRAMAREVGYDDKAVSLMVRPVWQDYERPRVTAARLSRLLQVEL